MGRSPAADLSLPVTGNLLGFVTDAAERRKWALTSSCSTSMNAWLRKPSARRMDGLRLPALPGDVYSLRVSLASFLPVSREKITIKAGMDSVLQIHLATLFSSVEVSYTMPTGAMTDDWKWVLRSSPATRPITRFLPEQVSKSSDPALHPRVFSGTHAMVSLSGGDGGLIDSDSAQGDFGTGFAVSTNLFGKNQLQVGGTFGQNAEFRSRRYGPVCHLQPQ